jgi:ABC-type bacteriocin/lantibiotic exporter with double-glycine peptidase domain
MRATEELMRGRTTFMIAHRLSTLKNCDLILVLSQGELVEIRPTLPQELSAAASASTSLESNPPFVQTSGTNTPFVQPFETR